MPPLVDFISKLSEEERKLIKDKVSDYIPQNVVKKLGANKLNLFRDMDEVRMVSTVFVGFGVADHAGDPGEHFARIQTLFIHCIEILAKYDGMFRQFVLDDKGCVLIVCFGVHGHAHADDASRAVAFARDLQNAVYYMRTQIGVTSGRLFCGCVGSKVRREFAVVGDSCNMASRLMSIADSGIRVDEATYMLTNDAFDYEICVPVNVKGKKAPLISFIVKNMKVGQNCEDHSTALDSFVGRRDEKKKTIEVIVKSNIGYITGPEGYGKSFLLEYAVLLARRTGIPAFVASGAKQTQGNPYHTIGKIVKQILRAQGTAWDAMGTKARVEHITVQLESAINHFFHREETPNKAAKRNSRGTHDFPSQASPSLIVGFRSLRRMSLNGKSAKSSVYEKTMHSFGSSTAKVVAGNEFEFPDSADRDDDDASVSSAASGSTNFSRSSSFPTMTIDDFLYLMHTSIDLGVSVMATKTVDNMSPVLRSLCKLVVCRLSFVVQYDEDP